MNSRYLFPSTEVMMDTEYPNMLVETQMKWVGQNANQYTQQSRDITLSGPISPEMKMRKRYHPMSADTLERLFLPGLETAISLEFPERKEKSGFRLWHGRKISETYARLLWLNVRLANKVILKKFNHIIRGVEAQMLATVAQLSQHTRAMAEMSYDNPRSQIDRWLEAPQLWALFETLHTIRNLITNHS
jgi:hypothetical protein